MSILIIQNCPVEDLGRYAACLDEWRLETQVIHPYAGDPLPASTDYDAILIGGTPASAYELHRHDELRRESEYLARAIALRVPCLGICFGAQLLAQLLGATVSRSPVKEIGGYVVTLTTAGRNDPLLAGFPPRFPVFHWHGDTFAAPVGAQLLVEGVDCRNQMFRRDSVVGVQFHLEARPEDAAAWADAYAAELAAFGKTKSQVVDECRAKDAEMAQLTRLLLANFLQGVAGLSLPHA
ncbi:MAG: type 1 glutamine amidotransferase [Candidatus Zixiibacteriota bacterium]